MLTSHIKLLIYLINSEADVQAKHTRQPLVLKSKCGKYASNNSNSSNVDDGDYYDGIT